MVGWNDKVLRKIKRVLKRQLTVNLTILSGKYSDLGDFCELIPTARKKTVTVDGAKWEGAADRLTDES